MFLISGEEFPQAAISLVHTIAGNAQNQNILINIILLDPKYVSEVSKMMYQSLAMITGGLMYQTPKRAAADLIPIIESRFQPDQVKSSITSIPSLLPPYCCCCNIIFNSTF